MIQEEEAERQIVIENNRARDAAESVRIDCIKTLLQSKKSRKDALRFILDSMGKHSSTVADGLSKHSGFAAELLGGSDKNGELARLTVKPTTRSETNMMAMVLTGFEKASHASHGVSPHPQQALPDPA